MKWKVVLLIALAVALLSVSVVCAYAAATATANNDPLKEVYGNYTVLANNTRVEGNNLIIDEVIYSEKYGSVTVRGTINLETGRGAISEFQNGVLMLTVDVDLYGGQRTATAAATASAISGVAGVGCLGTVIIKKRKGEW